MHEVEFLLYNCILLRVKENSLDVWDHTLRLGANTAGTRLSGREHSVPLAERPAVVLFVEKDLRSLHSTR